MGHGVLHGVGMAGISGVRCVGVMWWSGVLWCVVEWSGRVGLWCVVVSCDSIVL